MNGSLVQMVQFGFIIEKIKSVFNTFFTQNLPFCHIFLTLKCKQINPQSFSSEVLMILRGNEFLVIEKKNLKNWFRCTLYARASALLAVFHNAMTCIRPKDVPNLY